MSKSKSISSSLKKTFASILKVIILIFLCVGSSTLIVWPLWKFATSQPDLYTLIALIIVSAIILYFIIKKLIKTPLIASLKFIINTVVIITGVTLSIKSVLNEQRITALIILLATIAAEMIINIIFSKVKLHD